MSQQPANLLAVAAYGKAQQALIIKAQLDAWVATRGGSVKVIANLSHLWEELMTFSDAPRLLITFLNQVPRGDDQLSGPTHRVDRYWQVTVVRGHGFKNVIAEPLGNQDEFLLALDQIEGVIRSLLNISGEFPVEYRGTRPMPQLADTKQQNVFLDAYSIEFSTCNDLPDVLLQAPGQ